jgi:hypothetical protein
VVLELRRQKYPHHDSFTPGTPGGDVNLQLCDASPRINETEQPSTEGTSIVRSPVQPEFAGCSLWKLRFVVLEGSNHPTYGHVVGGGTEAPRIAGLRSAKSLT